MDQHNFLLWQNDKQYNKSIFPLFKNYIQKWAAELVEDSAGVIGRLFDITASIRIKYTPVI